MTKGTPWRGRKDKPCKYCGLMIKQQGSYPSPRSQTVCDKCKRISFDKRNIKLKKIAKGIELK